MSATGTASMLSVMSPAANPMGVSRRPTCAVSSHSSQLPIHTSTVQAITRTRACVRSSPVKARLTRTSTPSDAGSQGWTTNASTSGAAHSSHGTARGFSISAERPRYCGSTTWGS